jgi:hypothetical protein
VKKQKKQKLKKQKEAKKLLRNHSSLSGNQKTQPQTLVLKPVSKRVFVPNSEVKKPNS